MVSEFDASSLLREMTAADVPDVLAIQEPGAALGLSEVFPQDRHHFPRDAVGQRWLEEIATSGIDCDVVLLDGAIVGFAAVRGDEFLHFGIAVEHWGTGVAQAAHDAVLDRMHARGVQQAWLRVFTKNSRGRRFYERQGWRATGDRTHSSFPPYPELLRYERTMDDRGPRVQAVGLTRIAEAKWSPSPSGSRSYEQTVRIGHGAEHWRLAAAEVLRWGVKTRSGFAVRPDLGTDVRVAENRDYTLVARVGPFCIREPVRVLSVVDLPDRCGFAYGTRPGHPVEGEEAFIVHRDGDGGVWFTQRSLTRPGFGAWRFAFPAVLVAQRWYRRRYALTLTRVLRDAG